MEITHTRLGTCLSLTQTHVNSSRMPLELIIIANANESFLGNLQTKGGTKQPANLANLMTATTITVLFVNLSSKLIVEKSTLIVNMTTMRGISIPETAQSSLSTSADASGDPVVIARPHGIDPQTRYTPIKSVIVQDTNVPVMISYM